MQYTLSSNWFFSERVVKSLITDKNAVKVFPEPVGEDMRMLFFLLISMIDNGKFQIEFVTKCAKARFKIGRCAFPGHVYDMVVLGAANEDLRSDSRKIFQEITEFLLKIK